MLAHLHRATDINTHGYLTRLNRHSRFSHVAPGLHRHHTGAGLAALVIGTDADLAQRVTAKTKAFGHLQRVGLEAVNRDGLGFGLNFGALFAAQAKADVRQCQAFDLARGGGDAREITAISTSSVVPCQPLTLPFWS